MTDRFKYAAVRQKIIDAIRTDLIGPQSKEEILDENPRFAYLVGMLEGQDSAEIGNNTGEQEIDTDIAYEDEKDFTAGEDDDNEPVSVTHFQLPSSIGISFYIEDSTDTINLDVYWGDYSPSVEAYTGKDGRIYNKTVYARHQENETVAVRFKEFSKSNEYALACDSNVHVYVSRISLQKGYALVTAYLINKRSNAANSVEGVMFQAGIKAYAPNGSAAFLAENICRKVLAENEFYFAQRPIMGRGRGCAVVWTTPVNGRTTSVESAFIPEYEFPGVSAALDSFDKDYFSTCAMGKESKKADTLAKLNTLADAYDNWINNILAGHAMMRNQSFSEKIGNNVIAKCQAALSRIREGIHIIESDKTAFEAFRFMNNVIFLQNSIKRYAKKHGAEDIECSFKDFVNPKDKENAFGWRPFQIAFILMNLAGIVDPRHRDREIVDLLYFPTGGGKTEAYLGLMAFVIANRRLHAADKKNKYNLDGGVTVILRYTLRLLTTQQRDRITKMVVAAECMRSKNPDKYGHEPITIGFWVGGGVTPNKFEELVEKDDDPYAAATARKKIYKQILTCPYCGKKLDKNNFYFCLETKSIEIYCSDKYCLFYKHNDNRIPLPIYLIDEEIYAKCPTIILSTVDKFARLPWSEKTNALFGRVDRKCDRHGYVAMGAKHNNRHNKTDSLPSSKTTKIKPFLPPELIIQDELHLITGPLGTVYGAYETIIEKMCSHDGIKPKYVVSTATIKNADVQARCLYARKHMVQFPPNGFEIGDSFFIKEISTEKNPFRKYVGVCAPGQSMKNAQLRLYAIILQTAYTLFRDKKWKKFVDPYYTLIGYFNSIRELGGAVRLLQDDIPKRIYRISKKYKQEKSRPLFHNEEITSRMSSYQIPEKLHQLEIDCGDPRNCLDTAVATNMIAVGMDVDRLGLMEVHGQPKQNSEYIQATSRIGRAFPGLVVTLYNAYRPRDLSHYENFTGYHSQLYRFVEGTTATPFSARARDRVMHALVVAALRLICPEMASNEDAAYIIHLEKDKVQAIKKLILDRLEIIKPSARKDAEEEIDSFIDWWKQKATQDPKLRYYVLATDKCSRLMNFYDKPHIDAEKPTLNSMREVESSANMYYFVEE